MRLTIFLCVVFSVLASSLVSANFDIVLNQDKRQVIELGSFGFSEGGVISISFRQFHIAGFNSENIIGDLKRPNATIGFAIDTVDTAQTARSERDFSKAMSTCFAIDPDLDPVNIDPQNGARVTIFLNGTSPSRFISSPGREAVPFTRTIQKRSLYGIFFFNCLPGNPPVTMNVHVEEYNVDAAGQRNYLSYGDRPLGSVYLVFCLFFGGLLVYWRKIMGSKSQHVKRVHSVVSFLILIKCLSLFFETFRYFHYASTGQRDFWDFFYYVFLTLKGVTLFTVIVLLGSGWSSARAFLTENDRKLLLFLLPAQVFINISIAVLEDHSEGLWWWGRLLAVLRFLDVLCLLAVLLPLVWSMRHLTEAAEHEDKAAVNLQRMRTFRTFYLVFVGYIYCTRVVLVVIVAALPFYMLWMAPLFRELCAACLYSYIIYAFRPGPQANPYEVIDPEHVGEDGGDGDGATSMTEISKEQQELKRRQELVQQDEEYEDDKVPQVNVKA